MATDLEPDRRGKADRDRADRRADADAPPASRAGCPTSSRPTTRKPTSRGWSTRPWRPAHARRDVRLIAVNDGSSDGTVAIADTLVARHPDVVRVVHHEVNLGYGEALRSGFGAARYELVAFTDGDRQFEVADLGRLTARSPRRMPGRRRRLSGSSGPTRSCGSPTPVPIGWPTASSSASRSPMSTARCKLFRREALEGLRVESVARSSPPNC